ncbi:hypothetical protein BCT11_04720 [Vibrio sp. 10N.222.52.B12]|nr:hypothetical protein BCT11_04720 [Vibrio sp. 10N.222.52.B12]
MPKITLLLLATTVGIGITGSAFCVGVTYAFTQLPIEQILSSLQKSRALRCSTFCNLVFRVCVRKRKA